MHSSTYRFNWEISIMFCGLFFRKICVRKNSRSFFSPKKAANSFSGRPSEDRGQSLTSATRQRLKLTLFNFSFSTLAKSIFLDFGLGWMRNQGNESSKESNCWELKSFHLATTSPIESRWSWANLIRKSLRILPGPLQPEPTFALRARHANPIFRDRENVFPKCTSVSSLYPQRNGNIRNRCLPIITFGVSWTFQSVEEHPNLLSPRHKYPFISKLIFCGRGRCMKYKYEIHEIHIQNTWNKNILLSEGWSFAGEAVAWNTLGISGALVSSSWRLPPKYFTVRHKNIYYPRQDL